MYLNKLKIYLDAKKNGDDSSIWLLVDSLAQSSLYFVFEILSHTSIFLAIISQTLFFYLPKYRYK